MRLQWDDGVDKIRVCCRSLVFGPRLHKCHDLISRIDEYVTTRNNSQKFYSGWSTGCCRRLDCIIWVGSLHEVEQLRKAELHDPWGAARLGIWISQPAPSPTSSKPALKLWMLHRPRVAEEISALQHSVRSYVEIYCKSWDASRSENFGLARFFDWSVKQVR